MTHETSIPTNQDVIFIITPEPRPYTSPKNIIFPGGAVAIDSGFYIQRLADSEIFETIHKERALITVRGPRQIGKTSLMMHLYARLCQEAEMRAVYIDFQSLTEDDLRSSSAIWQAIVSAIAEQLRLTTWRRTDWDGQMPYTSNVYRFIEHFALHPDETPLIMCFDEVDRLFASPLKSQFFKSLRAFYNSGAIKPPIRKIRWMLGTSSEPSFFIDNLTESPFNIGLRVELPPFTAKEVADLGRRHGIEVDQALAGQLVEYLGGQPYLVHLLLYHLARRPDAQQSLLETTQASAGIFKEHLERYWFQFQRDHELADAMRYILHGLSCENIKLANRLEAAGLIRWNVEQRAVPACRLYAEYFSAKLGTMNSESPVVIEIYPESNVSDVV